MPTTSLINPAPSLTASVPTSTPDAPCLPYLDSLEPSERRLAQLVSLFPPEGVDKFVLRHLWTDYLREPATVSGKETFATALQTLIRHNIVFVAGIGDTLRMTPSNRELLQKDLGDDLPGEAYRVSDILSAWIGFSPFPFRQEELRRIAETSPLGHSLVKELDILKELHALRLRETMGQSLEAAQDTASTYRLDDDAIPLEWAEFLESGDDRVFADNNADDIAQTIRDKFSRRHWVYAFQNRGYGPRVNELFTEEIGKWNFFDRLACLRDGGPAPVLFANRPEWRSEAEAIIRQTAE